MHTSPVSPAKLQRGAAALAVSVLLLLGLTFAAFYANRNFIFEQRASANQSRATAAFDLAEAGLEWATGRLNDDLKLDAAPSCAKATTSLLTKTSFKARYIVPTAQSATSAAGFYPPTNSKAACTVNSTGTLACTCPAPGTAPTFANTTDPRFVVQFNAVAGDPLTVEILANGCSSDDTSCGGTGTADARQVVRVQLKVVPTFGNAPGAALTTGSAAVTGGNLSVVNTDLASNGITINSGTTVTQGSGTNVQTVPGTPPRSSILDNDPSLNALTSADTTGDLYFQSFFGKSMDAYRQEARVISTGSTSPDGSITCSSASSCGAVVSAWYDQGEQEFWVYPDVQFTNANLPLAGTLGTLDRPIYIAGDSDLELKSNLVAYGLLYAATATATENWDYSGSGSGTLFGALVSRGSFNKGSGTLNVVYDPRVFGLGGAAPSGLMAKVPGSWRDKSSVY